MSGTVGATWKAIMAASDPAPTSDDYARILPDESRPLTCLTPAVLRLIFGPKETIPLWRRALDERRGIR